MRLLRKVVFVFGILLSPAAQAMPAVTVMADSSISIAVSEIARNYSRDKNVVVNTSFLPPAVQQAQINEGGAVDLLITPRTKWLDDLKTQGLIDIHSQTAVARNRLVLVGPADSTWKGTVKSGPRGFPAGSLIAANNNELAFVVGNPETLPEGIFAKQALRKYGVAGELEPYTLYIHEFREMYDMVANHHAYGLFFRSSIYGQPEVKMISLLPESSHSPINYYAVVIAGDNMDEARKFLQYLTSAAAKKTFEENGLAVNE